MKASRAECRALRLFCKIELVKPEGCERAEGSIVHNVGKHAVPTNGKLIGAESMNVFAGCS